VTLHVIKIQEMTQIADFSNC